MQFDFDTFASITAMVFPGDSLYSLEEALEVFRYYFEQYEQHTGKPHPHINAAQIAQICEIMPFLRKEGCGGRIEDLSPDTYVDLIDQHFRTNYRRCDWNINHFFSGRIRENRFYEVCY